MPVLEGETLRARIMAMGRLSPVEVLTLARRLAEPLEVVHAAGLLHRDIKPENVFLASDKRVVLIDFGAARHFGSDKVNRHTVFLTPGFSPPEQYDEKVSRIGPPTDIYALAVTLYDALLGTCPPSALERVNNPLPQLPAHMPAPLRRAIETSLSFAASQRPQNVADFPEPPAARPGTIQRRPRASRERGIGGRHVGTYSRRVRSDLSAGDPQESHASSCAEP